MWMRGCSRCVNLGQFSSPEHENNGLERTNAMKLPHQHFSEFRHARLLSKLGAILVCGIFISQTCDAAEGQADQYASQQIKVAHARAVKSRKTAASRKVTSADAQAVAAQPTVKRRPSTLARAANGQSLSQALSQMPPKPLDGSLVKGNVQQAGFYESYGGGCDCAGPVCDCGEAVCGVEPLCGFEPACGCDMSVGCSCGVEAGCGLEVLPGCGLEGPACGLEGPFCGAEVGCGFEPMVDCGCDACAGATVDDCYPLFLPILRVDWRRFDFFAGVQGYKGPMNFANVNGANGDRVGSGSFGFYEGFNEGHSLERWFGCDIASQFGLRATQSNLSGAEFTNDTRTQIFLTGGLFRRVDYGFQYGVVVDYLNDDWYFQGDLTQIRGELSWNTGRCHTFGYQFAAGTGGDTSDTVVRDGAGGIVNGTVRFEPTDQNRLFYRRTLNGSGSWSGFAGWSDSDDGILGASLNLPLRQNLVLQTGATYLIANEGVNNGGNEEESWNLSIGLVFRPGGARGCGRYCRPMFDVADNGTFMVDRR